MKLLMMIFAVVVGAQSPSTPSYRKQIEDWRKAQQADLLKEEGWLSVAGLVWLTDGPNSIGSSPSCKVVLPKEAAPANAGTLTLSKGQVSIAFVPGASATINGQTATTAVLKPDASGSPDKVKMGSVTFEVIVRGSRTGIRMFDMNCKGRREFKGEKWYPVRPDLCIEATYVPYQERRTMKITNVLGDVRDAENSGYVEFTLKGHKCRLEAEAAGEGFFFNFRDATTGKTTYPAGRFLDAPKPQDGKVLLDFNKATNPPCAFTSFATCPLPPLANRLQVPIEAGEKTYHVAD